MKFRSILVAVVGVLIVTSSAQASVTFTGDFETGDLSQWNYRQYCNDDATVYSSDSAPDWPAPVDGTYALRMSVADTHVCSGRRWIATPSRETRAARSWPTRPVPRVSVRATTDGRAGRC